MQKIIHGDCLEIMKGMEDNSIDFIVTDPPYGLNFMGKHWDDKVPNIEIWKEALRVCKPGSMLAAFGGSRTHHHLMIALEQAGWEIRDVIMWIYGSGFPKSHNHFGFEGYGTALKPAYEPIIIAMKPLDGTYAQNAEKWGVGGINIDESRVKMISQDFEQYKKKNESFNGTIGKSVKGFCISPIKNHLETKGRWPANIILDEEAAERLDEMTGVLKTGSMKPQNQSSSNKIYGSRKSASPNGQEASSGGASRFFYCAKASSSERNKGLDGMPLKEIRFGDGRGKSHEIFNTKSENRPTPTNPKRLNNHPTVKPISLMKYIIKLLAPPRDPTCLDPFAGSGSTLLAAKELGINCIGIEKEQEYCMIAQARIV